MTSLFQQKGLSKLRVWCLMSSRFIQYQTRELSLLDESDRKDYQHLTDLASSILDAPVSLISIIDIEEDRQFFKSMTGLQDTCLSKGQAPLSNSFCKIVADSNAPLLVSDSRQDDRAKDNLAIRDLNVIAYLGVPICNPQGGALGAICAIDSSPREWTSRDLDQMLKIADCVNDLIRLKATLITSEKMREQQDAFTYAISHDVRGPIKTLKMLLQEIRTLYLAKDFKDFEFYTSSALETIQRMDSHTSDLLDFAVIDREAADCSEIDLNLVTRQIVSDLNIQIAEADALIDIGDLPIAWGNRFHFRILLQNLIGNALKYRSPSRRPVISIKGEVHSSSTSLSISDNGIGIAAEYQVQIFKLFKRLHTQQQYAGTGLGLALCKRVVDALGGTITVSSTGKEGSTFKVTVPNKPSQSST